MLRKGSLIFALVCLLASPSLVWAVNGYFMPGFGAVNESMGGTSTAGNPEDVIGSLYDNPANAALFDGPAIAGSVGLLYDTTTSSSRVDAYGFSGSSKNTVDVIPGLNLGYVFKEKDSPFAYYAAFISEGGLHIKLDESPFPDGNPILFPQEYGGFGKIHAQLGTAKIPLGFSRVLDEKLTVGLALLPSIARLKDSPAGFGAPDPGTGTYATDVDHEFAYGFGLQAGLHYQASDALDIGFSASTPTWFTDFEWDVTNRDGSKREITFNLETPLTVQAGIGYQPLPNTRLMLDIQWINYSVANGWGDDATFTDDFALNGLGWDDIWVVSLGAQHRLTETFTVRIGYNYGENPIADEDTFFNVASILIAEHHLALGGSWDVKENMSIDFSYTHSFENSISGPWYDPVTKEPVDGTNLTSEMGYDHYTVGLTYRF